MVFLEESRPSIRALAISIALAVICVGTVAGLLGGIGAGIYGAAIALVGGGIAAWLLSRKAGPRGDDEGGRRM